MLTWIRFEGKIPADSWVGLTTISFSNFEFKQLRQFTQMLIWIRFDSKISADSWDWIDNNFVFKQQFDTDLRFSESFSFSFPLKVKDLEIFQKDICYDYVTCAHGNAQQTT